MGNSKKNKKSSHSRKKSRGGLKLKKKYRNLSTKPKSPKFIDGTKNVNQDLKISTKKSRKKVKSWAENFLKKLNEPSTSNPSYSKPKTQPSNK